MGRKKAKRPDVEQQICEVRGKLKMMLDRDLPIDWQRKVTDLIADLEELFQERGRKHGFSLCMQMLIESKLPIVTPNSKNDGPIVFFAKKKASTGSWWK